jgi:hypothetical protein
LTKDIHYDKILISNKYERINMKVKTLKDGRIGELKGCADDYILVLFKGSRMPEKLQFSEVKMIIDETRG